MRVDVMILHLAGRQLGLVTRPQLRALGLSPQQIERRLRAGVLVRIHQGVYRVASAPVTFDQRVNAAVLAGDGAAGSHRAAGRSLGLRGTRSYGGVEITVPRRSRPRLTGVKVHRSLVLDRHDLRTTREGVVVTCPERTIIDCATDVPPAIAARILDGALVAGLTTTDRLWIYLTRYSGPGCPGLGRGEASAPRTRPA